MNPPRTVIVTFNLAIWDGRAQKMARSLADGGWDTWLVGRSETDRRETSRLGRATMIRLPGRWPAQGWRRKHLVEFEGFAEVHEAAAAPNSISRASQIHSLFSLQTYIDSPTR